MPGSVLALETSSIAVIPVVYLTGVQLALGAYFGFGLFALLVLKCKHPGVWLARVAGDVDWATLCV